MTRGFGVPALLLLLFPAGFLMAAAGVTGADDGLTARELTLFIHQLLFVYWLGPDIGVYYLSHRITDPQLSPAQRLAAAQVMGQVDLIPRICLALMLTVGGLLTEFVGIPHPAWQMVGIVLLGPAWLILVLLVFLKQGSPQGAALAKIDFWFRAFMIVAVLASVAYSWTTGRLSDTPWVAGKLLLFALILFFGLVMRLRVAPLVAGVGKMAVEGPSPENDVVMVDSLKRTKPWVLAMWVCLLMAALMGVVQPGDRGSQPATELAACVAGPVGTGQSAAGKSQLQTDC